MNDIFGNELMDGIPDVSLDSEDPFGSSESEAEN